MSVPGFQEFMLPMLNYLSDGQERNITELYEAMAVALNVDEEDRSALLTSGRQSRFDNRVGWAKTYLTKAGLVGSPRRGAVVICPRGYEVLTENPARIDIPFLQRYPEFLEFQQATRSSASEGEGEASTASGQSSPEERLDSAFSELQAGVVQELIVEMKAAAPATFERLVLQLLLKMGYGGSAEAGMHLGKSGDEGIDAVINEDKLGLDVIYIQAKRWDHPVGRPTVQAFAGSLDGQRANKGIVLTTSRFTPEARDYVSKIAKKIILIDGERLAELMIEYKLGVQVVSTYINVRVDKDFFTGDLDAVV